MCSPVHGLFLRLDLYSVMILIRFCTPWSDRTGMSFVEVEWCGMCPLHGNRKQD